MGGKNRTQQKVDEGNIIAGLKKNAASLTGLLVQGKPVTTTQAVATLQARIDAITAAQAARVALNDAVKQQDTELASTDAFVASLVTVVRGMFADAPNALADFGLAPRKVTVLSAAAKQAAAEKRIATRKARNTLGKKQKAAIKGDAPVATTAGAPATTTSSPVVTATGTATGGAVGTHS